MLNLFTVENFYIGLLAVIWLVANVVVALLPFLLNVVLNKFFNCQLELLELIHKGELFVFSITMSTVGMSDVVKSVLSQGSPLNWLSSLIGLGLFINVFFSLLLIGITKMQENGRKDIKTIEDQLKALLTSEQSTVPLSIKPLLRTTDDPTSAYAKSYRQASYFCAGMAILMSFILFFQGLREEKVQLEKTKQLRSAYNKLVTASTISGEKNNDKKASQKAGQSNGE